ncbi:GNAT family N-acetyltransferase [Colwelliaceae bacterium 6441]
MKILVAPKNAKKTILRFYKSQHYSASFLGIDHCYYIQDKNEVVASVIISKIEQNSHYSFLHALVVKSAYQHRGLATKMLTFVQECHRPIVCFAHVEMTELYTKKAKMIKLKEQDVITELPKHLKGRLISYKKKQPQLQVFISQ